MTPDIYSTLVTKLNAAERLLGEESIDKCIEICNEVEVLIIMCPLDSTLELANERLGQIRRTLNSIMINSVRGKRKKKFSKSILK